MYGSELHADMVTIERPNLPVRELLAQLRAQPDTARRRQMLRFAKPPLQKRPDGVCLTVVNLQLLAFTAKDTGKFTTAEASKILGWDAQKIVAILLWAVRDGHVERVSRSTWRFLVCMLDGAP